MPNFLQMPWTDAVMNRLTIYRSNEIEQLCQKFNLPSGAAPHQSDLFEAILSPLARQGKASQLIQYLADGSTAPIYDRSEHYLFRKAEKELKRRAQEAFRVGAPLSDPILQKLIKEENDKLEEILANNRRLQDEVINTSRSKSNLTSNEERNSSIKVSLYGLLTFISILVATYILISLFFDGL